MKKAFAASIFYLIFGLAFGVFYREFTRIMDFKGDTALSFTHSHILGLGFAFFLIVIILEKVFDLTSRKYYRAFFWTYNTGLLITLIALIYRGILDVLSSDLSFLSYIAGTGHIIITIGFGFFMKMMADAIGKK
jgi:hypothetical protein